MANVIKYIYTSVPENTVKTYPFVIGVNFGGYGSTAATGYWNGKTPNVGGYVVYVSVSPPSSPTIYVADNDTQLINLCNQLFGTGVSTVGAALQTFNGSTTTCCVNVDYSNIVTSGLVLNLDAGYTPSYPRTGTSWTDLSGSGYTGTLINGPTYSSDGGGCIVSDGVDDGVTVPDSPNLDLTNFTLDGWVWFNQHKNFGSLLVKGPGGAGQLFNYCFFFYNTTIVCGFGDETDFYSVGIAVPPINTWHHIVGTWDSTTLKFYLNGVLINFGTIPATPYQNAETLNIIQVDYPIDGKVISAKVYNRALSATEILQNYYAGLQRFIPTDGLVLYLDGNNTNKQVMTASTANDISGNNYNGTLTNGVPLDRDGQRSFSFDGVDDKIQTTLNTLASSTTWTVWVKRTTSVNFYNMFMGMYLPYFGFRSDGSIHFSNNIGGVQQSLTPYPPGLVNNVWYHMSFVSSYTGNTTMSIYLDGAIISQQTYTGQQLTTTNNSFRLGGWEDGDSYPFNGKIGNVRIYNRALTATEISTIYTATKSRYGL